ncbi:hypothetical protein, partial [Rhizobium johnstonii]|uniref:hypothetical protein n=1 Tax=Rhizobium johnstonii TaxID=3019933 RepID=UPI003F9D2D57
SDKSFSIICHGSSSCDEDRLGLSEQPSENQCRASHLRREDGHTALLYSRGRLSVLSLMWIKEQFAAS